MRYCASHRAGGKRESHANLLRLYVETVMRPGLVSEPVPLSYQISSAYWSSSAVSGKSLARAESTKPPLEPSEDARHVASSQLFGDEVMRDGRSVEPRALRPDDEDQLLAAIHRTSPQSLFRRFFAAKRGFTEQEIAFFLNIDFVNHVALVAVVNEGSQPAIVGGGR